MSRPESGMSSMYCQHGFPRLICNRCAAQAPCVHGMLSDCLLCAAQGSDWWGSKAALGMTAPDNASKREVSRSAVPKRDTYPWIGRITPWSTPLKRSPKKQSKADADVPRGTEVTVTGAKSGWLHVQVTLGGKALTGYISHELVHYVRPIELSLRESLVLLKRTETEHKAKGSGYKPSEEERGWISVAIGVVNGTGKYVVNETTYLVSFRSSKDRIKIDTIEDFVLFVEEVERQYSTARPGEIAAEIRQIWFSDENWEMLSAGMGVESGGAFVDIETKPNPLALKFDMGDMSPSAAELDAGKKNKRLSTAMGTVEISHVIAGLDTRLNGFPSAYPADHLKKRKHDNDDAKLKYEMLKVASSGNSRDFATWAGDIGQAYTEFLVSRYVKGEMKPLADFVADSADDEAMLGDIHGYIAIDVWKSVPESESPTAQEMKISNIPRGRRQE